MSTLSNSIGSNKEATTSDTKKVVGEISGDLISGLEDQGWKNALSDAIRSESFQNLESFLEQERATGATIYPPQEDVFSAFNLCPLDKVKVVIVGQDPYHGPGQGHGLAFSVRHGIKPPPSLKNIVREAMEDVGIDEPTHGDLEHWAKQGVLLFNTVLTVRRGEANSHSKQGWEDFTDAVIRVLNERQGVVFLLWGNPAAKKAKGVDDSKHVIIQTSHPSPLGVTKTKSPFRGSRCFSRANKALEDMGSAPINWSIL
jgi:uracil-DNA glycosylase